GRSTLVEALSGRGLRWHEGSPAQGAPSEDRAEGLAKTRNARRSVSREVRGSHRPLVGAQSSRLRPGAIRMADRPAVDQLVSPLHGAQTTPREVLAQSRRSRL